ncbi:MAG TPA: oligosaccharide flippase family protein, partial [Bryobacteraceae bacterium]|nr:oligosaccharide flippase family protein [Bryobacteraceae bacterium]
MQATATAPANSAVRELQRLVKQSSHYLLGIVGGLAVGFISFPIFTRTFSVAEYGLIDLVQKVLLLVIAFSKGGLQNSVLRFFDGPAFRSNPGSERRFYSTMFTGVGLASMAVYVAFAVVVAFGTRFGRIETQVGQVLVLAAILIPLRSVQSVVSSFLRVQERTRAYSVTNIVIRAGTVAAVLAMFPVLGRNIQAYFWGTVLVEAAVLIWMAASLYKAGVLRFLTFDRALFVAAASFGLPLIVQELAGIVLDSGDRFLVQSYLGAEPLGY